MSEICIFDPKSSGTGIYSFMRPGPNPEVLVCQFGGETLEELKAMGRVSPEAFLCPWEEAETRSRGLARERHCKGPERVSCARWWEMLEVLFPGRWEHLGDCEVFMVPEMITSNIYCFGVRIRQDYFLVNEDVGIASSKLIEMCKEVA